MFDNTRKMGLHFLFTGKIAIFSKTNVFNNLMGPKEKIL